MVWLPFVGMGITLGSALVLVEAFFIRPQSVLAESAAAFDVNPARARADIGRILDGRLAAVSLLVGVTLGLVPPSDAAATDSDLPAGAGASAAVIIGLALAIGWKQARPALLRRASRRISRKERLPGIEPETIEALLLADDADIP